VNSRDYDVVVNEGSVLIRDELLHVNLGITDGKISTISSNPLQGGQEINASERIVVPGVVDPHMHVWYGHEFENFTNATEGAAKGGVTTIIDMPLDKPFPPYTPELVQRKIEAGESQSYVDFGLFGGVSLEGGISGVEKILNTGIVGIKIFPKGVPREGFYKGLDAWEILQVFKLLQMKNLTAAVHPANADIDDKETKRLLAEGLIDPEFFDDSRPALSELESTASTLILAQKTGCRVNFCHMSFAEGVSLINDFKAKGVRIFAETCPHYLTLTRDDLKKDKRLRIHPPLRADEKDRLWQLLKEGKIDTIGSDHAPLPKDESKSIWEMFGGLGNTVEIMFPLMLSEGIYQHDLSLSQIIRVMSENPARIYGLFPRKGRIGVGSDADLIILQPGVDLRINANDLSYLGKKWSPWDGWNVKFKISQVLLRGRPIVREGKVVGNPGDGRFVSALC
jgi:allantoinase